MLPVSRVIKAVLLGGHRETGERRENREISHPIKRSVAFSLRQVVLCSLLFIAVSPAWSQSSADSCLLKKVFYNREKDSLKVAFKHLDSLLSHYKHSGYLEAVYISVSDSPCIQYLVQGNRFLLGSVEADGHTANWFRRSGTDYRNLSGKVLSVENWESIAGQVIRFMENHGHPFASVSITELSATDEGKVDAVLNIDPGPLITYRMLVMPEEAPVSVKYLERYLGIIPGHPYREIDIRNINALLDDLPFIAAETPVSVQFTGEEATVFIFPVRKPANRFDFVLGVLPMPAGDPANRRVLITGMADLMLINPWKLGQTIGLSFRQTRPETQELRIMYQVPYILGTPLGAEAGFELYRRDTMYLDLHRRIGVQYAFRGRHYLEGYWDFHSSSLLSVPVQQIRQNKMLPPNIDFRRNSFGVKYIRERLDYRFNPSRGFALQLDISAGTRQILRNPQITGIEDPEDPDFSYASLYHPFENPAIQWMPKFDFQYFYPLANRHVLHANILAKAMLGAAVVSENEKFRVGGFRIMRGFDEESILAPAFGMGRLEYRFLLDRDAHFHLFFDQGAAPDTIFRGTNWTFYSGFGAGLQFQTAVGVFGISYALGRTTDIPLDLRTGKVHFGYAAMF